MKFTPLIKNEEIRKAFNSFSDSMKKDGTLFSRTLIYPSNSVNEIVSWIKSLGIWSYFDPGDIDKSHLYWCPFGVQDPSKLHYLNITCEINFPKEGIYRRVAGVFVRDDEGNVYVTHNGNVGGGRKSISGSSFRKSVEYNFLL